MSKKGFELLKTVTPKLKEQVDSFLFKDGTIYEVSFVDNDFILKAGASQCIICCLAVVLSLILTIQLFYY